MQLTDLQERAVKHITTTPEPVSSVAGYAGTGKTTVLAKIAQDGGFDILTPTHKAADVLRRKGVPGARTLHSVLYAMDEVKVYRLPDGSEVRLPRGKDAPDGATLIGTDLVSAMRENTGQGASKALIDEGSMVTPRQVDDLLTIYDKLVLIGDPFQLPPVKSADLFQRIEPSIFLDEVHRTAMDNPITRYATALREGEDLGADGEGVVEVSARHPQLYDRLAATGAQGIVWTNALRHKINAAYRDALGYPPDHFIKGERLICLSNVRQGSEDGEKARLILYNGQEVEAAYDGPAGPVDPTAAQEIGLNGNINLRAWPFWSDDFFAAREHPSWRDRIEGVKPFGYDFDYAYALTAHKAQGSEWPLVAVWDQRAAMRKRMGPKGAQRWFYTAVTRARDKLILVK